MVHRDQRLARGVCERLAGDQPDHHPTDQPRPRGRGDRIDIGQRQLRIGQGRDDQRLQCLDMRARGDLGDYAAERRVRRFLPQQPMRQDLTVAGDERGGSFVAGGFDAENDHRASV
jgi:hypothetical protein